MTTTFFEELKDHLQKGVHEKGHPFRFGVLGTVGPENKPALRTIVLRAISNDLNLTFFTDARSTKIEQLKKNSAVSILFYHPKEMLQIKVEGIATIITDKNTLEKYWSELPEYAHKDYTTETAPGSLIEAPNQISYLNQEHHFSMVEVQSLRIEYLKLNQTQHTKLLFDKKEGVWQGEFLVP